MRNIKQTNIKNRTYYLFNDINIKDFDSSLLKLGKKSYKKYWYLSHWIHCNKKNDDYENIHSVNQLYLTIDEVDGYIKENNGKKYLTFASTDKKKKVSAKSAKRWDEIEYLITPINGGECNSIEAGEYEKHFMKIKFNSDGNLPSNKLLKLDNLTVIVKSVFEEDDKYYSQDFLNECWHEL